MLEQERDVVALPLRHETGKDAQITCLAVMKRFEYQPQLLRSGVLAADYSSPGKAHLYIRGAPSAIEQLIGPSYLPSNFDQVRNSPQLRFVVVHSAHVFADALCAVHHIVRYDVQWRDHT